MSIIDQVTSLYNAGVAINWTDTRDAIVTIPQVPWQPAGWSGFNAIVGLNLSQSSTFFGLAQATNGAGMLSDIKHSGPLQVGQNVITASSNQQVLAFNTQVSSTVFPQNGSAPGETTGALVAPPGTLPNGTYLQAGVITGPGTNLNSSGAVHPLNTSAPDNFMFDGYSFSAFQC